MGDEWFRVEKDVFLGKAFLSKGFVFVKRKKEEEFDASKGDRAVIQVHHGRSQPPADSDGVEWEARPGGIWLKRILKPGHKAVNAVDVLFGADAMEPRPGWELAGQSMSVGEEPRLSVRRGETTKPVKPVLRIGKDGKFRIMQVSGGLFRSGVAAAMHDDVGKGD